MFYSHKRQTFAHPGSFSPEKVFFTITQNSFLRFLLLLFFFCICDDIKRQLFHVALTKSVKCARYFKILQYALLQNLL